MSSLSRVRPSAALPAAILLAGAGAIALSFPPMTPIARSQAPGDGSTRVTFEPIATLGGMAWSVDVEDGVAHVGSFRDDATVLESWDLTPLPVPRLVGMSASQPGRISDVAVSGDTALAWLQPDSPVQVPHWTADDVRVFDVGDPRWAIDLGVLDGPTNESLTGIDLEGGIACLAAEQAGMWIYDLAEPSDPRNLLAYRGQFANPARCAVRPPYVYAAAQTELAGEDLWLDVFDLRNPAPTQRVGRVTEGAGGDSTRSYVLDLAVADEHVLAAGAPFWMWNVDVSDPTAPRTAALVLATGYVPTTVAVSGTLAYVAASEGSSIALPYPSGDPLRPWTSAGLLRAYDIADPERPRLMGETPLVGLPSGLAVWRDRVLVAAGNGGLQVFRVVEGPTPERSSAIYLPAAARGAPHATPDGAIAQMGGAATSIVVAGEQAVVGLGARLVVMDIRDPRAPVTIGATDILPAEVRDVAVEGTQAYVLLDRSPRLGQTGSETWLGVVDVRDPARPVVSWCEPIGHGGIALAAADGLVIVARGGESHLAVFDHRAGGAPIAVGKVATRWAFDTAAAGRWAYVVDAEGLRVIDLADPARPSVIGTVDIRYGGPLTLDTDYAYVSGSADDYGQVDVLSVVDVSNPGGPRVASTLTVAGARDLAVRDGLACLVGDQFQMVDVSDPLHPRILATEPAIDARGLARAAFGPTNQLTVYAIAADRGIRVFDVVRPEQPTSIGFAPTASISDVAVGGALLVAAAGNDVAIFETRTDALPARVGALTTDQSVAAVALDRSRTSGAPSGGSDRVLVGYAALGDAENVDWAPSGGLLQIDLTEPSAPRMAHTIRTLWPAVDVAVAGRMVALAEGSGVRVFDTDLRDVVRRGDVTANRLAVRDDDLFALGSLLHVFDLGPYQTLELQGLVSLDGVDLATVGDALYVADGERLHVIDAAERGALREVGSLAEDARALAVDPSGTMLYAAGSRLARLTLEAPLAPRMVDAHDLPCEADAMAVDESHVYVAAGACGLLVLPR